MHRYTLDDFDENATGTSIASSILKGGNDPDKLAAEQPSSYRTKRRGVVRVDVASY